jgi:hypothetical protein
MARQRGIIKLTGKVGDLSFYKTQDGFLAREKGGVEASRIKNDPAFIRTRENGQEFGMAAKAGKLMRDAFRPLMMRAADGRVVSRMTKTMSDIRKLDATSARGDRSVAVAIADQPAKDLLKDFNFNRRSILKAVLFRPFTVDSATGVIVITDLVPANHLAAPSGATHVAFTAAWGKIDFGTGGYEVELSNTVNVPIDGTNSTVTLTPAAAPAGAGTDTFLLVVEFFQEVNGNQYSLNDGLYNALSIVDVA